MNACWLLREKTFYADQIATLNSRVQKFDDRLSPGCSKLSFFCARLDGG